MQYLLNERSVLEATTEPTRDAAEAVWTLRFDVYMSVEYTGTLAVEALRVTEVDLCLQVCRWGRRVMEGCGEVGRFLRSRAEVSVGM